METTATQTAAPCRRCQTTGGLIYLDSRRPRRARGLCQRCYDHESYRGRLVDWPARYRYGEHVSIPTGLVTPTMLGITAGQPPTDPGLTTRKVWEIAHLNARKAIQWLVNTGRMTPDEAAALVMLSYTPPSTTTRRAA